MCKLRTCALQSIPGLSPKGLGTRLAFSSNENHMCLLRVNFVIHMHLWHGRVSFILQHLTLRDDSGMLRNHWRTYSREHKLTALEFWHSHVKYMYRTALHFVIDKKTVQCWIKEGNKLKANLEEWRRWSSTEERIFLTWKSSYTRGGK